MNILHHKTWHTRRKDNIAVARRDEADHKKWLENVSEKNLNAESESRLNKLRNKEGINDIQNSYDKYQSKGIANPEYELEKKKEQETYEKRVGILTGLGQSVSESKSKIWYLEDPHQQRGKSVKKRKFEEKEDPLFNLVNSKKSVNSDKKKASKSKKISIDELRQQRLAREAKDKKRQEELFTKIKS